MCGTLLVTSGLASPSAATLTSTSSLAANVFGTGAWYFLHNSPTPPTGTTTAVNNLAMGTPTPTQATLYNYDTNQDSLAGRVITKSGTGAGDATLAHYANWRTAAFASSQLVNGSVTVHIWSGITGFPLAQKGVLIAYLRDFNPILSTYVEIANATLTDANWQAGSATWVQKSIVIPVANYTIPGGHRLELKVETTSASYANMVIAYDTTGYPSALSLP